MGKADAVCKAYMADASHFADVFNYFVFDGKQAIEKEELTPLDPEELAFVEEKGVLKAEQRYRDVLKEWNAMSDGHAVYVLLGIENQSYVDYAMPVRAMLYDAMQYMGQVSAMRREHQEDNFKGLDRAEKLSGISRNDRITPVVTLVLHFGASKWDGPFRLHDMLAEANGELTRFVPDYQLNIVTPATIEESDFSKFSTNLGRVLRYIKHSKSRQKLARIVSEDAGYAELDEDSARLINAVTNSRLRIEAREGKVDMCEAIEEMRRESWEAGMEAGMEAGRKAAEDEMEGAVDQMRRESWEAGMEAGRKAAEDEMEGAVDQMRKESWDAGRDAGRRELVTALVASGLVSEDAATDALRTHGITLA